MKVQELIKKLIKLDQEECIVIQVDGYVYDLDRVDKDKSTAYDGIVDPIDHHGLPCYIIRT